MRYFALRNRQTAIQLGRGLTFAHGEIKATDDPDTIAIFLGSGLVVETTASGEPPGQETPAPPAPTPEEDAPLGEPTPGETTERTS